MNLALAIVLVVLAVSLAVGAMYCMRRWAPERFLVSNIDSAAAVLGFMGTAFALLLAFVIFLGLETYNGAKQDSLEEADSVLEQFEIANLFPTAQRDLIRTQLVCYSRGVSNDEWDLMRSGKRSPSVDGWAHAIEGSIAAVEPSGSKQTNGVDKFYEETLERAKGRRGRLNEADGSVAGPLWVMLLLSTFLLLGYMLLFANIEPRAFVQIAQIGFVTGLVAISLVLITFLDHPFRDGPGRIPPSSMRSVEQEMSRQMPTSTQLPCNNIGRVITS